MQAEFLPPCIFLSDFCPIQSGTLWRTILETLSVSGASQVCKYPDVGCTLISPLFLPVVLDALPCVIVWIVWVLWVDEHWWKCRDRGMEVQAQVGKKEQNRGRWTKCWGTSNFLTSDKLGVSGSQRMIWHKRSYTVEHSQTSFSPAFSRPLMMMDQVLRH
jgi:hypothetical protein